MADVFDFQKAKEKADKQPPKSAYEAHLIKEQKARALARQRDKSRPRMAPAKQNRSTYDPRAISPDKAHLPTVKYQPGLLHEAVDELVEILSKHPNIYQHKGRLVYVDLNPECEEGSRHRRDPMVLPMSSSMLRVEVCRICNVLQFDGRSNAFVVCTVPGIVLSVIRARGTYPNVKALDEVFNPICPLELQKKASRSNRANRRR